MSEVALLDEPPLNIAVFDAFLEAVMVNGIDMPVKGGSLVN